MSGNIEGGLLVSVVGAVVIEEVGVGKPRTLNLDRLVDEKASIKDKKSGPPLGVRARY